MHQRPPPVLLHCSSCPRVSPDTEDQRSLWHLVDGEPVQCGICFADANPDSPGAQPLLTLDADHNLDRAPNALGK